MDAYSRKAVSWLVSWQQDAETAKLLIDQALTDENILDLPEGQRPEIMNDRGRQMKAKPVRQLLEDHAMPQLFSRPRTPNDNPFIESAFSTVKCTSEYPGVFLEKTVADNYFNPYFRWYNEAHYHSGIDYVTPVQAHQGLREKIVSERKQKLNQQRQWRKAVNRGLIRDPHLLQPLSKTVNPSDICSVIHP